VKTEAPLIDPSEDRPKRLVVPGRPHVLKAGTVLQNRYRVLDVLGVGGMSTVYKARDLRFTSVDRSCAVKEMFNSGEDPKIRQLRLSNFQREAALLATLTHSAIPRIYDYFEQQGTIYLVLELIQGNDLETLLSQRGEAFEEKTVVDWAIRLCSVMSYLHNQQPEPIIFRDLKPSNVMIRAEDEALMLVDFGIARSFAPQQRGTMIGTEGYAPPEQYKGIADARGDIYALGATLHHLATGSDPRSETPFTFAQRPPRRLNPDLSPEFEELILKCVSYSPSDRFQSGAELIAALERVAASISAPRGGAVHVPAVGTRAIERDRSAGSGVLDVQVDTPPASPPQPSETGVGTMDRRVAWTVTTGDEIRSSASVAGGSVYVGSYDGHLYAIDESDGAVRWKFRTQRGIVSRPAPYSEMVVFGGEDKTVYAVTRQHGRLMWTLKTNAPVRSSAAVDERSCFIGSDDGFMYRVDRQRGHVVWRFNTLEPIRSTALLLQDAIIFGSDNGYLYNVQKESGSLTWRHHIGAPVMSSPIAHNGIVTVGANDGTIRGFRVADGKLIWTVQTDKMVLASPAIVDESVYVGSADGHMVALALDSGAINWKVKVCKQITSTAAVDGELLYVGGNDSVFYCLAREDGSVKWTFDAGGAIVTRPLVTGDHIIFGSLDGTVYASTGRRRKQEGRHHDPGLRASGRRGRDLRGAGRSTGPVAPVPLPPQRVEEGQEAAGLPDGGRRGLPVRMAPDHLRRGDARHHARELDRLPDGQRDGRERRREAGRDDGPRLLPRRGAAALGTRYRRRHERGDRSRPPLLCVLGF
jgi:outer membrane protein assembly factor BamB/tRNA A-37 threonylcarbamoyl transferase component Bud32